MKAAVVTFGDLLQEYRVRAGLSQEQLADKGLRPERACMKNQIGANLINTLGSAAYALRTAEYRVGRTCFIAALLSGCGGSPQLPGGPTVVAQSLSRATTLGPNAPHRPLFTPVNLYVANAKANTVTVYAPRTSSPLRTISAGIKDPASLAFDTSGNLYVANKNTVTIYQKGKTSIWRTISKHVNAPFAIAFNASDLQLYVANYPYPHPGSVTVYSVHGAYIRTITSGVYLPTALAIDSSGNVYVANSNSASSASTVTVYSSSTNKLLRTITAGISDPRALAFDSSGNLYAANAGGSPYSVTVYCPGCTHVSRTISKGIALPLALAFGSNGYLTVANYFGGASYRGSVTQYAPGSANIARTITKGISLPYSLAFGSNGYLSVANLGYSNDPSVTQYAPGSENIARLITKGINYPDDVTFGP